MQRALLQDLNNWLQASDRKPLILRGARQVGKTWLVRFFAQNTGKKLIELNFEKTPAFVSLFDSNEPRQILLNLGAALGQEIQAEHCLLFLDEIQVVPELLSKLRWFAEEYPQLPIVTAGSLLEFVLAEHSFSMPVGRINYMHLEPLSFEEFVLAQDKKTLYDYLQSYDFSAEIPEFIHAQLINLFKEYLFVGGLPAAVMSWKTERSLQKMHQIQSDLLATYRDDFNKYRGRIALERLQELMHAIPTMLGQKFISSRVNAAVQSNTIKQVLDLLEKARLCHRVRSCAANGVPLASEIKEKYFKLIFLDVGLCSTELGLGWSQIQSMQQLTLINSGGLTEQVVGQLLRTIEPAYIEPALYCWQRDERGSNAEIDYVLQHANQVIPIEVKAGSTGSLKSLHLFMGLKKYPLAVRINSDFPSRCQVDVKDHLGKAIQYQLLSIPLYLTEQIHRLIDLCQ